MSPKLALVEPAPNELVQFRPDDFLLATLTCLSVFIQLKQLGSSSNDFCVSCFIKIWP